MAIGEMHGKILKSLGQPAFLGKKKEKQIQTLLEAVKGGMVCVKFPDEVSHSKMKPHNIGNEKRNFIYYIYIYILCIITKNLSAAYNYESPPPPV